MSLSAQHQEGFSIYQQSMATILFNNRRQVIFICLTKTFLLVASNSVRHTIIFEDTVIIYLLMQRYNAWLKIIPIFINPDLGLMKVGISKKEVSIYSRSSATPDKFAGASPLSFCTFIKAGVGASIIKMGMVLVF